MTLTILRGLCADDPETWVSGNPVLASLAAHICEQHCPVFDACHQDLRVVPPELLRSVTQAGVIHTDDGTPSSYRTAADRCGLCPESAGPECPECGEPLPVQTTGRPRRFCSQACTYRWHDRSRRKVRTVAAALHASRADAA